MHESSYVKVTLQDLSLTRGDLAVLLEAVLSKGGCFRFAATGCSMSPFVKDGDVLLVTRANAEKRLALGDVVVVRRDYSALVCHRVIRCTTDGYYVKGDNNAHADGLVGPQDVLGHVVGVERKGKRITLALGWDRPLVAILSGCGFLTPLLRGVRCLFRREVRTAL